MRKVVFLIHLMLILYTIPLFTNESHKPEISSNTSGKVTSDILMNPLRGPVELSLIATFTIFHLQDVSPKHWPQSDCLLQLLLQRII